MEEISLFLFSQSDPLPPHSARQNRAYAKYSFSWNCLRSLHINCSSGLSSGCKPKASLLPCQNCFSLLVDGFSCCGGLVMGAISGSTAVNPRDDALCPHEAACRLPLLPALPRCSGEEKKMNRLHMFSMCFKKIRLSHHTVACIPAE